MGDGEYLLRLSLREHSALDDGRWGWCPEHTCNPLVPTHHWVIAQKAPKYTPQSGSSLCVVARGGSGWNQKQIERHSPPLLPLQWGWRNEWAGPFSPVPCTLITPAGVVMVMALA